MTALAQRQSPRAAQYQCAQLALIGCTDKEKVNFALALMMNATDPDAHAALRFAANELAELSNRLLRADFERECG